MRDAVSVAVPSIKVMLRNVTQRDVTHVIFNETVIRLYRDGPTSVGSEEVVRNYRALLLPWTPWTHPHPSPLLRPHPPSFITMSKTNVFQALSYSNFSHRARFGALLGGILFVSAIFLYQVHPPHLEDFGYTPHSPSPQHAEPVPGSSIAPPSYGMLASRIAYQEKLYQGYLQERKGLITRWGPTADKVKT